MLAGEGPAEAEAVEWAEVDREVQHEGGQACRQRPGEAQEAGRLDEKRGEGGPREQRVIKGRQEVDWEMRMKGQRGEVGPHEIR